ncbi:band 7 protein [Pirellula staleyi DSM 6068]|uniref:Band 7 protein n=1 Tax=Pirellula staleyi (strain ATCC 27377 / DSM 6068 / ICPB 4128) TaxID=530564 RepID=D2R5X9_PIRSD|nr:SPFH domain-containing protein [Pirellula staleyi]ADB19064.1 band 7 protein [Pirellula staleyi DSM 6068]
MRKSIAQQFENGGTSFLFYAGGAAILVSLLLLAFFYYSMCRIEVPTYHMAVLTKKTGKDLPNDAEIAPTPEYKGVQLEVLGEGRHFRNPWFWDWEVIPQIEVPKGKIGVRVRLYGDDPPYGEVIAWKDTEKGIVPDVLVPGRYAINAWVKGTTPPDRENYAEYIELHDPVQVPAGFRGVKTNLAGELPTDPNKLLTEPGKRGVEAESLDAKTHAVNPYVTSINLVDCRSQRFNLGEDGDMGFPSKDGFWVTLDGIIEFRVKPEEAAHVFVLYNELDNDMNGTAIDKEIIKKVVLPNARAFCRLKGSDYAGKDFISGDTRTKFQEEFQKAMEVACESQGIEIVQALITKIYPPQQIAEPVRTRQIAIEQRQQYSRELLQQESEKQLAIETEMNDRKQQMVQAEQKVIKITTEAEQAQEIALIEANKRLKVAELGMQAATDIAAATVARGAADARVIEFNNEASAAGWKKAVDAFGGDGDEYARMVMLRKLAPAFRSLMVNTADSPIMEIFKQYQQSPRPPKEPTAPVEEAAK